MTPAFTITPFPVCPPHQAASRSWNVGVMPVPAALEPLKNRWAAAAATPTAPREHADERPFESTSPKES